MATKRALKDTAKDNLATYVNKGEPMKDLGKRKGFKKNAVVTKASKDELENFNTRIISALQIDMKVYCVKNKIKIQDFVNEAIDEKLKASRTR
jgi:hypothetical protein